jgi:hypothetical protein
MKFNIKTLLIAIGATLLLSCESSSAVDWVYICTGEYSEMKHLSIFHKHVDSC